MTGLAASGAGATPHVLLTNDDGWHAPGLHTMRAALEESGLRVTVVAPTTDHTAGSRRISMTETLELTRVSESIYSCEGTPTDCVRVALLSGLLTEVDMVISGMNHGANLGEDIVYAGTVAAAAEAALLGWPALAVSQDGDGPELPFLSTRPTSFPGAADAGLLARHMRTDPPPAGTLVNLNYPLGHVSGSPAIWCELGTRAWRGAQVEVLADDGECIVVDQWSAPPKERGGSGTDMTALRSGRAAITLLSARGGLHHASEPATELEHAAWRARVPRELVASEFDVTRGREHHEQIR